MIGVKVDPRVDERRRLVGRLASVCIRDESAQVLIAGLSVESVVEPLVVRLASTPAARLAEVRAPLAAGELFKRGGELGRISRGDGRRPVRKRYSGACRRSDRQRRLTGTRCPDVDPDLDRHSPNSCAGRSWLVEQAPTWPRAVAWGGRGGAASKTAALSRRCSPVSRSALRERMMRLTRAPSLAIQSTCASPIDRCQTAPLSAKIRSWSSVFGTPE